MHSYASSQQSQYDLVDRQAQELMCTKLYNTMQTCILYTGTNIYIHQIISLHHVINFHKLTSLDES